MRRAIGRPKLPDEDRGKRVLLYLSADALRALDEIAGDGERSSVVSRLIVEEYARKTRRSKKST